VNIKPKLMWRGRTSKPATNVVQDVARRTEEAAQLAKISGQNRLTDPRTNPAVRAHADRLLNKEHERALDAAFARKMRRHRVNERRAGHAERALNAIQEAQEARSPAESVLFLHRRRKLYVRLSLLLSVGLAGGSAMGLESLAEDHNIPVGTGYIVELGLTCLATIAIQARADLSQHRAVPEDPAQAEKKDWRDWVLWALVVMPLTASMAANVHGHNVLGALCAAGAAAFSLFSYIVSDLFASAAKRQSEKVAREDEKVLRDIASGDDLLAEPERVPQTFFEAQAMGLPFTPVSFQPPTVLVSTPVVDGPAVPTRELNASDHPVATDREVTTSASAHPGEHSEVPTPKPTRVTTGEHKPSGHSAPEPTGEPSAVPTGEQKPEPTGPVPTREPMATKPAVPTPKPTAKTTAAKAPAKRRTRDQIRAELEKALKKHYDNGGGEPQVKPLADELRVNRRIVRELLDDMNVRPMIRKAANQ
jgi:hypothetical protein